nr:hypothetical protein [Tanacetum cinerariifolium]
MNLKLLRSVPSEWKTRALIWGNKADIETISLDDLYNNLKIYEPEFIGSSSISQNPQNVVFVSSNSTSNTNEADNTAFGVSTAHSQALKNQEKKGREYGRKTMLVENPTENALIAQDGIGGSLNNLLENRVSDKVKTGLRYKAASLAVESFVNSSEMLKNHENVKSRSDKGYYAVPPPYTGNYIPPKPNIMFIDEQVKSKSVDVVSNFASSNVKTVESKHKSVDVKIKGVYNTIETKHVRKNSFSPLIIEDYNSNDESKVEFEPNVG